MDASRDCSTRSHLERLRKAKLCVHNLSVPLFRLLTDALPSPLAVNTASLTSSEIRDIILGMEIAAPSIQRQQMVRSSLPFLLIMVAR